MIFADLTGVYADANLVDRLYEEVLHLAAEAPAKPYLLSCWTGAKMSSTAAERYGQRLPELLEAVAGIVRYSVTDPATRIRLQTQLQRHPGAGALHTGSLYITRAEALEAIRQMREVETTG
jgi:hypothetical protein